MPPVTADWFSSGGVKNETLCTSGFVDDVMFPQPQATCTINQAKFGRVVFELCERTDRQTNRTNDLLIAVVRSPPGGEVDVTHLNLLQLNGTSTTNIHRDTAYL